MNSRFLIVTAFSLALVFGGCAGIKVYDVKSDGTTGKKSGFDYHPMKTYLAIEKGKDTQTVKVFSLPDISRTKRIKVKRGIGATELSFTMSNGMLTTYGQKVDSKVPETITAIAGGVSSLASGLATLGLATPETGAGVAAPGNTITYVFKIVGDAQASLKANVTDKLKPLGTAGNASVAQWVLDLTTRFGDLNGNKKLVITVTSGDDLFKKIAKVRADVGKTNDKLKTQKTLIDGYLATNITTISEADYNVIFAASGELGKITAILGRFAKVASGMELYEVIAVGSTIEFRPVNLGTP